MSSLNYEIRLAKDEASQTRVWEGRANSNGITVQYGITGRKLRAQYIPLAQIPNGDTIGLLETLAAAQMSHGYRLTGRGGTIPNLAVALLEPDKSAGQPASPEPTIENDWGEAPPEWFV
jgi:hypothetical protein